MEVPKSHAFFKYSKKGACRQQTRCILPAPITQVLLPGRVRLLTVQGDP